MDPNDPGYSGYKEYSRGLLRIYDAWVLGVMAPLAWRTGDGPGLDQYRELLGPRHLDVGPGTGYFLAHSERPTDVELTLLDANPNVLAHCAERLAAWDPELVEANVLRPLPLDRRFDSVAMTHVIHCLPGPMDAKAPAVAHVADVLVDDGVLFGGTVLGLEGPHNLMARGFLRVANRQGSFDNLDDDVDGLRSILEASFEAVEVEVPGSIAYFVARGPRR